MSSILQKLLLCIFGFSVVALMIPIVMRTVVDDYVYRDGDSMPRAQTVLVLGASVVRGAPSPVLAARADAAIDLYQSGKASNVLVTGDSEDTTHDEVTPVRDYLLSAGIPAADIVLDRSGLDTYSSMYRARDVFAVDSIVIVTQDFHLPRALWIARALGMQAHGVVAGNRGSMYDYVREIPASAKALMDVAVGRLPESVE